MSPVIGFTRRPGLPTCYPQEDCYESVYHGIQRIDRV